MIDERKLIFGLFFDIKNYEDKLNFNDIEFNNEEELENYVRENFDLDVVFGSNEVCDKIIYVGRILDSNYGETIIKNKENIPSKEYYNKQREIGDEEIKNILVKLKGTKYENVEVVRYFMYNKLKKELVVS